MFPGSRLVEFALIVIFTVDEHECSYSDGDCECGQECVEYMADLNLIPVLFGRIKHLWQPHHIWLYLKVTNRGHCNTDKTAKKYLI